MHTGKLKVKDGVYDKLILLLSKFNIDEVEIISETSDFAKRGNTIFLSAFLKPLHSVPPEGDQRLIFLPHV